MGRSPEVAARPPLHVARALLRGGVAAVGTEVVVAGLLIAALRPLRGDWGPPALLAHAVGFGLGGALAWAAADLLADRLRRGGLLLALLAGGLLVGLAAVGGEWALLLAETGSTPDALDHLLEALPEADAGPPLLLIAGALLLHGPLLWVRRRGRDLADHVAAMTAGAVGFGVGVAALGLRWEALAPAHLTVLEYALLLLPRALLFPVGLALADRVGRAPAPALRTRAGGASDDARRQARRTTARATSALEAGDLTTATAEQAKAQAAWPTIEGALLLARARARAGEVVPAAEALLEAGALTGGRPAALDAADPDWLPLRGHPGVEALLAAPAAERPERRRWRLAVYACIASGLVVTIAAPQVFTSLESAETTTWRVVAHARDDAYGWRRVALQLEHAPFAGPTWAGGLATVPRRFGVGAPEPSPADKVDRALRLALRRARSGDVQGMVDAASIQECVPALRAAAQVWWRRAAEAGNPHAMWRWSEHLRREALSPRGLDSADSWCRRAAERGELEAIKAMGLRAKDEAEAARWREAWRQKVSSTPFHDD